MHHLSASNQKFPSARERREQADHDGFWSGLNDRLFKKGAEELRSKSEQEHISSKALRERYLQVNESTILEHSTCLTGIM